MRKSAIFFVFILTLLLIGGTSMAGVSDHPNYSNIESFKDSVINFVNAKQNEFFINNLRYFQGLRIPEEQCDGITEINANVDIHPSDQADSWYDLDRGYFKRSLKLFLNLSVDVYQSPEGWGNIINIEFWYPNLGPDAYGNIGDHWIYRYHIGPGHSGIFNEWFIIPESD